MKTVQMDKGVLKQRTEWLVDETRIEEVQANSGWDLEIQARHDVLDGRRTQNRDASLGRDPQFSRGDLDEKERSLQFGLIREFLEAPRKKQSEIVTERLKQLDRMENMLLEANKAAIVGGLAYLDVYYGRDLSSMLNSQVAFEEENHRILKTRLDQYEALPLDVLTTEVKLETLRKRLADEDVKNKRKLELLKEIWSHPNLLPEQLAPPVIQDATPLESAQADPLVQEALRHRADLDSHRAALSTLNQSAPQVKKLPELEMGVAGRMSDFRRDYTDTDRKESGFDVLLELNFRLPLSLQKENALRERQYQLNVQSRQHDVAAQEDQIARNVRQSLEDYQASCREVRISSLTIKQLEEQERVTRLTAFTMPETMKGNPDFEIRKATSAVLEARADLIRSVKMRTELLLLLLGELGRLAPMLTVPGTMSTF